MTSLTIDLPDDLRRFIEEQAGTREGRTPEQYVREVLEQRRQDEADLAETSRIIAERLADPRPGRDARVIFDELAAKYGFSLSVGEPTSEKAR